MREEGLREEGWGWGAPRELPTKASRSGWQGDCSLSPGLFHSVASSAWESANGWEGIEADPWRGRGGRGWVAGASRGYSANSQEGPWGQAAGAVVKHIL